MKKLILSSLTVLLYLAPIAAMDNGLTKVEELQNKERQELKEELLREQQAVLIILQIGQKMIEDEQHPLQLIQKRHQEHRKQELQK